MEAKRENMSDNSYRMDRQRSLVRRQSNSGRPNKIDMPERQGTPNRGNRPQTRNPHPTNGRNYRQRMEDREEFNTYEDRELERIRRNRVKAKRRRKQQQRILILGGMLGCFLILLFCLLGQLAPKPQKEQRTVREEDIIPVQKSDYIGELEQGLPTSIFYKHPYWTEDFLTLSDYARPGESLPEVKNIFVHYTANRNTSAAQNRSYFEGLKDSHETAASAHFIIGYEGEIIQCVPLDEIAYAVKTRNYDSISIECCYKSEDGSFSQKTYDSLIGLLKWLTQAYNLTPEDILRHYDCGGKLCPLYYTENPDEWEKLKKDVAGR